MKGKMYKLTGTGMFGKTRQKGTEASPRYLPKSKGKSVIPNARRDLPQTGHEDKRYQVILPKFPAGKLPE